MFHQILNATAEMFSFVFFINRSGIQYYYYALL